MWAKNLEKYKFDFENFLFHSISKDNKLDNKTTVIIYLISYFNIYNSSKYFEFADYMFDIYIFDKSKDILKSQIESQIKIIPEDQQDTIKTLLTETIDGDLEKRKTLYGLIFDFLKNTKDDEDKGDTWGDKGDISVIIAPPADIF